MTTKEIQNIRQEINRFLSDSRLHDAFVRLKNVTEGLMIWDISEKVSNLEENYAFMLKYLAEGVEDPAREKLLSDLITSLYRFTDELTITLLSKEMPTLFYNVRRYEATSGNSLGKVISQYEDYLNKSVDFKNLLNNKQDENLENDLFNSLWTTFPYSKGDVEDFNRLFLNPSLSASTKISMLSAVTLGALEYFDREKVDILIEMYTNNVAKDGEVEDRITAVALIGLIFVLMKYKDRRLPDSTLHRLTVARDLPCWISDLKTAVLEIIRTRDTERINKTMRDEIIPSMMALKPEIEKKLKDGDIPLEDFDGMQMNPEWEDLLNKSGISKKLKELNELQMEGSDVFMSTFGHLKNFPFFNNVYSWFIPFASDSSSVEKILSRHPELSDVAALIETLPFLCDNDKYSMMFAVDMVPQAQRSMMLSQIEAQREQMGEMATSLMNDTAPVRRRRSIRNYLQNFYRFYNLFRRKSEFFNAFDSAGEILLIDCLSDDLKSPELINLVAEFYFKRGYWKDALVAFTILDRMNEFSSTVYQKMGFCYEKSGDMIKAVEVYEQADLLDSSSLWLKKRLAKAYRTIGRLNDAIRTYNNLTEKEPENTDLALSLGYTLIQAERFKDAIKLFYKVEFLDPNPRRALRPLAWSLFMTGNFEKAKSYYSKILLDNPGAEDYLNMGHVALALGEFKEAINYYKLSVLKSDGSAEKFFKTLETDRPALALAGIQTDTISLVADAMLYTLHS